jgi:hypothetical protein
MGSLSEERPQAPPGLPGSTAGGSRCGLNPARRHQNTRGLDELSRERACRAGGRRRYCSRMSTPPSSDTPPPPPSALPNRPLPEPGSTLPPPMPGLPNPAPSRPPLQATTPESKAAEIQGQVIRPLRREIAPLLGGQRSTHHATDGATFAPASPRTAVGGTTVRPAREDPFSPSQADLIKAGDPPRPDLSRHPAAYQAWLRAVSSPMTIIPPILSSGTTCISARRHLRILASGQGWPSPTTSTAPC